jgi:SAM-dependent methyltransferase
MLCRSTDFYYGEIPRDQMQHILAEAEQSGWQRAIWNFPRRPNSMYFVRYVTSHLRSPSKFLLDRFGQADVLDYGCGLGGITTSLAANYRTVLATDLSYERAAFTALRARQDGFDNVPAFCCGDTDHIPLQNGAVDIALLNGVLEWVAEWRTGDPRQLQVHFLREVCRVLRPDGLVFIGIENRPDYSYFMGRREDHTHLRFGAILPRRVANAHSLLVRKRPYRTYTYTHSGYCRLLNEAGLRNPHFYALLPDYRQPERVIDLSDHPMCKPLESTSLRKKVRNLIVRPLLPWIVHSFGITASPDLQRETHPDFRDVVEHIGNTILGGRTCAVEAYMASHGTPTAQIRVYCHPNRFLITLPINATMEARLAHVDEALHELNSLPLSPDTRRLIPQPIATGRYQGQLYLVSTYLPGQPASSRNLNRHFARIPPALCNALIDLGIVTKSPAGSWAEILRSMTIEAAQNMIRVCARKMDKIDEIRSQLDRIQSIVATGPPRVSACTCALHGDFWHENVLLSSRGRFPALSIGIGLNANGSPCPTFCTSLSNISRRQDGTGMGTHTSIYTCN